MHSIRKALAAAALLGLPALAMPVLGTPATAQEIETVDPDLMPFCQQGPVLLVDEVTEPAD